MEVPSTPRASGEENSAETLPESPMIELRDVRKSYQVKSAPDGVVHALDGASLRIERGAIHGIVGESGAGKSTLIRCLTALERPTSGTIEVDGQDLSELSSAELRRARLKIGMVFQAANLLDSRTTAGNVAYPLYLAGVPRGKRHERVGELLSLVGLEARASAYPSQLSGGQKQRVGIARALATNAPVLLCDEPTSALDRETTMQVLHLIRALREKLGVTVIIITHEMSVVREICDSVSLLAAGKIVQSGRVEDILKEPTSALASELMPPPKVEQPVEIAGQTTRLLDVAFTSQPGEPTGSRVLSLAASIGADVTGGTFETVGTTQVGKLVLTVPEQHVNQVMQTLQAQGLDVKERQL